MSEFFLCEIENIEKSGVEIKVTGTRLKKDDDDCIRTVRTVCFDFSEHDKVFEDKIVELKKDYKTASELLGKYQQENEALKNEIADLKKQNGHLGNVIGGYRMNAKKAIEKEVDRRVAVVRAAIPKINLK